MKQVELYNDEIWRDIPNFHDYQASNYGRIRSKERAITQYGHKEYYTRNMPSVILKPKPQNSGYLVVWLRRNGRNVACTVHRIIAQTFLFNSFDRAVVNHKDGDKTNNRIDNLEWVTQSDNIKHSYKYKLRKPNKGKQVICESTGQIFKSIKEAAEKTNTNPASIGHCLAGRAKTAGGLIWKM